LAAATTNSSWCSSRSVMSYCGPQLKVLNVKHLLQPFTFFSYWTHAISDSFLVSLKTFINKTLNLQFFHHFSLIFSKISPFSLLFSNFSFSHTNFHFFFSLPILSTLSIYFHHYPLLLLSDSLFFLHIHLSYTPFPQNHPYSFILLSFILLSSVVEDFSFIFTQDFSWHTKRS